jgi:hypothetical protein
MKCSDCKYLEGVFESRLTRYIAACSAAYYRVSTEFAAKKNVDMERAKNDLEEHQQLCPSVAEIRGAPSRATEWCGARAMGRSFNWST